MSKYVASHRFRHPRLGEVNVRRLSTATRITARWKNRDLLVVTVPRRVTSGYLTDVLAQMENRLTAIRPEAKFFTHGWRYITPEMQFEVLEVEENGKFRAKTDAESRTTTFFIPTEIAENGSVEFNAWVNRQLHNYARRNAEKILLPEAYRLAEMLNAKPTAIAISYGEKVLGRCNSRGEILLSRALVFYPNELRKLVYMHELAHLEEMNHSPLFYAVLNEYLGGRHKELRKWLGEYKLPFIK